MQIDLENPFALKVRSVVENYARQASTPVLTAVCDARSLTYILLAKPKGQNSQAEIFAIIRVIAGWVLVDEDRTAAPLVDLFVQNGIEREKIVLAYAGEAIPNLNLLLAPLLKSEVHRYAGHAPDAVIYPVLDDERQTYAIVDVPNNRKADEVYVINMAHMVGDKIVIDEECVFDKPLYEALIWNAGIPRSHIILAYNGESLPSESETS
ncbi:MAG: hypothetical protein ABI690_23300 [Chloroflexota bacterium]